jgi:DNA-binding MarR family transcriptional regulator
MEKAVSRSSDDSMERDVVELLRELLHAFLRESIPVWVDLPLTLPQLRTVFIIAHNKTSSVMQIAQHLGIGEPTASHLVDKLVQAGLVDRSEDPTDRRRAIVRLSPAGEELIERLLGWEKFLGAGLHKVSGEDLAHFQQGLSAIVNAINEQTASDGQTTLDEEHEVSTL